MSGATRRPVVRRHPWQLVHAADTASVPAGVGGGGGCGRGAEEGTAPTPARTVTALVL